MSNLARLRELMEKATPLPLKLNRYDHGGGRLFRDEPRKLVADFYDEEDRELFVYMRNLLPQLIAVAEAAMRVDREINYVDEDYVIERQEALLDALKKLNEVEL